MVVKVRFYVVYLKDLSNVRILPYQFASRQVAWKAIEKTFPKAERKHYTVYRGSQIKDLNPTFYRGVCLCMEKWDYPKNLKTRQEKKSHRTLMRRRLRRMGLLTINPVITKPGKKTKQVKRVVNKQQVAKSPNTVARVIQVDAKGKHNYYYVRTIEKSPRVGILFRLETWRVNTRHKTCEAKTIKIKNLDVIKPLLCSELLALVDRYQICLPLTLMDELRLKSLRPIRTKSSNAFLATTTKKRPSTNLTY